MYELFIEGYRVDIDQKLSVQLSYAIDDVSNFSSRETGFSKTIVLPGTAYNNKIFGFIYNLASFNYEAPGGSNIGAVFNVAQTSRAELRLNGLLVLKGVFRITNIVNASGVIEYEGALFGELSGFVAAIGNKKIEDLDFSNYDHEYNTTFIVNSWTGVKEFIIDIATFTASSKTISVNGQNLYMIEEDDQITISDTSSNDGVYTVASVKITKNQFGVYTTVITVLEAITDEVPVTFGISVEKYGYGYFYPLIDYGTYSTDKINYDIRTLRPALYVNEYIEKMFISAGYTYESEFFKSDFFRRLVVPHNGKNLSKLTNLQLTASVSAGAQTFDTFPEYLEFDNITGGNFTVVNDSEFTYTPTETISATVNFSITASYGPNELPFDIDLMHNGTLVKRYTKAISGNPSGNVTVNFSEQIQIQQNDVIRIRISGGVINFDIGGGTTETVVLTDIYASMQIVSTSPQNVLINPYDNITVSDIIPRNIMQKDFFTWVLKMFNLYVTEDKLKDKHLIIEPYIDFYGTEIIDWTYKVARDKPWQIKPMGMLNGRFFEYKFKEDSDYYNENYKKRFNQSYGDRLEDTGFQFAKDKQSLEIGFSPSVLVEYDGTDKTVPAIYKKNGTTEERMDSNIRILQVKLIEGVDDWDIKDDVTVLESNLTSYGYGGHFDDPKDPTKDINFGAAQEIFFNPNSYTSNNLFNDYWSGYLAEIADKDSKLLSCYVHLTPLDIAKLDFGKVIMIDGVLFRLNKVEDYDYMSNELTKVELLKIINNG